MGVQRPFWLELLMTIVGTLIIAILIRVFIAETYEVPSGSMLETIQLGDRLVGEKVSLHFEDPQAGDIVTFNDPDGSGVTLIKRVVATAGDVVDLQDGRVILNGQVIDEPYTQGKPSYALDGHATNLSENITYPITIPSGMVWVMGDNRTNSLDSRYFGPVSLEAVTSKAIFIYWPISDIGTL
ncbi:MAG: signal peptidase I [Atopobiaceae bacterium]|nr:signal peptidase I [Atopobiaceae bacterium]